MAQQSIYIASLKFSPGLAKEFVLLGDNLRRHGFNVTYLLSSEYLMLLDKSDDFHFLTKSTDLPSMMIDCFKSPLTVLPQARKLFQRSPPKFLLIYNFHPLNISLTRLASQIYAKGIRAVYLHEPFVPNKSSYGRSRSIYIRIIEWLQTLTLHYTNGVIVPSQHSRSLFKIRYPKYRGQVYLAPILLPNGSRTRQLERRYVSLIGNLNQSRGPEDFLALINHAATHGENLEFKLMTRTSISNLLESLLPQARRMLTVVNKPIISDEEIAAAVAESQVIFLPHKQAAQSGNIPVAFREGTPVIARDIPGLSQHVYHRKNGYLFPVEASPQELLEAVHFVRDNFPTLSHQARKDFEDVFSEDNWDHYYQWLIEATRG